MLGPRSGRYEWWLPYALIGPASLLLMGATVYPTGLAFYLSLSNLNLEDVAGSSWVGLSNYFHLVSDHVFITSVLGSVRYIATVLLAQLVLSVALATYLNSKIPARGLLRSLVLLPYVVPSAVVAIIWIYMFDANFGSINGLLTRLGVMHQPMLWLADADWSRIVVEVATVWSGTPFMTLVLLAALQGLPGEVLEAAVCDGANAWQRFWHVVLPQLMPTILLLLLLRTMWLSHYVDLIYLITNGGPGVANYTLAVYSYLLTTVEFRVGYAGAIAVVLSVVLLGAGVFYMRSIERARAYL